MGMDISLPPAQWGRVTLVGAGPGDVFLMCTDAWWEYVEEPEMERLLDEAASPEAGLARMGEAIRQRAPAENDNYTAVCVKLAEETTVILPARGHDPAVSD